MTSKLLFLVLAIMSCLAYGKSDWDAKDCIPIEKIDLNPFREIINGKDLAYLMLLRSYISTDDTETGILDKYEFSPNGKVFTAKVSSKAKWADGTIISSFEAAIGIAKTLQYRLLGQRVKVEGTESLNSPGWESRTYSGIEIIDDRTFRIRLVSDIKNLTGVLREALSTNSRHNRFWPIRLDKNYKKSGKIEVLAKFPFSESEDGPVLNIDGLRVLIANMEKCGRDSDFSMFPEFLNFEIGQFRTKMSPVASAVSFQANLMNLPDLQERTNLIGWIRTAFSEQPITSGILSVDSFFLMGEPGYNAKIKWQKRSSKNLLKRKFIIGYEIPAFKTVVEKAALRDGIKIDFVSLPYEANKIDGQMLATGMQPGRHLALQDILEWRNVREYLHADVKTTESLEKIAKLSAATVPPDLETLQTFEKNAFAAQSIAPIARKYPTAFSNSKLSVCLDWTSKGEMTFSKGVLCSK